MPLKPPIKVGVNGQFQMPKYENRSISKTVNPIKPKFEGGWATIALNQIQHG